MTRRTLRTPLLSNQTMTAKRNCLIPLTKARDQWAPSSDGGLHAWKRQRGTVAFRIDPHFSDPQRIGVLRIFCDDVTQTPWKGRQSLQQHGRQRIALSGRGQDLADQSVHLIPFHWGNDPKIGSRRPLPDRREIGRNAEHRRVMPELLVWISSPLRGFALTAG